LILPPEAVNSWLTGTPEQAKELLVPYPSELMRAHRVTKRVNKPENDDPNLVVELEGEPAQLTLES
jgi:putative SOS response-associated peptidase YedK